MWHRRIAFALAILAVVLLAASGLGVRAGLWPFRFGFGMNDVTTDTSNPPQFSPSKIYESHFAELQRIGYPDLQPLQLEVPPAQAFARARAAAQALGWEVVAEDERAGRIEAVATTRWFGFKDDIAVRVSAAGGGSRVDVRSKSRVGRSDLGANARRIRGFLAALK